MDYKKYLRVDEKLRKGGRMTKDKKSAMAKVIKTIKSAKTDDQLEVAREMAANFMRVYGDDMKTEFEKEISALPLTGKVYDKIFGAYKDQKDRVKHLKKVNEKKMPAKPSSSDLNFIKDYIRDRNRDFGTDIPATDAVAKKAYKDIRSNVNGDEEAFYYAMKEYFAN